MSAVRSARYGSVLFDLDGTLTDPGIGITNSVIHALGKFGIAAPERSSLYRFIGPPLWDSFRDYYGFSGEDSKRAVAFYREYYAEIGIFENGVYPGIPDLLCRLEAAGMKLALASSKPEVFANRILDRYGLAPRFRFVSGSDMDGTRGRKADVIARALEGLGAADTPEAIMVGDREHDILGAKEIGIDSMGVLFGYGNREELERAGADFIAASVADIGGFLLA